MLKKIKSLGAELSKDEMKQLTGGTNKTRWACHNDPTNYSWVDYLCWTGPPNCPYPCDNLGVACHTGDYTACVM